jgi:hypothetical protein
LGSKGLCPKSLSAISVQPALPDNSHRGGSPTPSPFALSLSKGAFNLSGHEREILEKPSRGHAIFGASPLVRRTMNAPFDKLRANGK